MKDWKYDKGWSDRFLPEIKRILGEYLIAEAPMEEDAERATDLMVLTLGAMRVGCRIRRPWFYKDYGHEFTIRSSRSNGTKTELAKIIEGWGDYIFYGFSDEAQSSLHSWILGDLNVFRLWHSTRLLKDNKMPGTEKKNTDGSSEFRAYLWAEIPRFVIAPPHFVTAPKIKQLDMLKDPA